MPRIGDIAPDFEVMTTTGKLRFSEYAKGSWTILFSHPADFTPVCTTEMSGFALEKDFFAARGAKLIGLSIDSIHAHIAWVQNVREKTGVLFEAAAEMGAVLGDRRDPEVEAVRRFARHFGLAYQALDDLRDGASSVDEAGKDVNKDKNRVTLVTRFGSRLARQACRRHLKLADAALVESGVAPAPLRALVSQLFRGWTPG